MFKLFLKNDKILNTENRGLFVSSTFNCLPSKRDKHLFLCRHGRSHEIFSVEARVQVAHNGKDFDKDRKSDFRVKFNLNFLLVDLFKLSSDPYAHENLVSFRVLLLNIRVLFFQTTISLSASIFLLLLSFKCVRIKWLCRNRLFLFHFFYGFFSFLINSCRSLRIQVTVLVP